MMTSLYGCLVATSHLYTLCKEGLAVETSLDILLSVNCNALYSKCYKTSLVWLVSLKQEQ